MNNTFDTMFYPEGDLIGGIDEAGVSDIAGPLIAACVILPKIDIHRDDLRIFEVNDSKKIPEKYRKQHAEVVWQVATAIGIGETTPAEIDYLGNQAATSLAMLRAVAACKKTGGKKLIRPDFILVDGIRGLDMDIKQRTIKQADAKSLCVAAASIVAKVYRDEIMIQLHHKHPQYDWLRNKGYPCENQFKGLDSHGIQVGIHRTKFWPFRSHPKYSESKEKWRLRRYEWRRTTEFNLGAKLWKKTAPSLTKTPSSQPLAI